MAIKSPDKILFENWTTPEKQEKEARGILYHNLANNFSSGHCAPIANYKNSWEGQLEKQR